MFDYSGDITKFYYDETGSKDIERLSDIFYNNSCYNNFLHGDVHMTDSPSASDLIKLPFYIAALNILGVLYWFFLIFLLIWRWFLEKPYTAYRRWKNE